MVNAIQHKAGVVDCESGHRMWSLADAVTYAISLTSSVGSTSTVPRQKITERTHKKSNPANPSWRNPRAIPSPKVIGIGSGYKSDGFRFLFGFDQYR